MVCPAVGGRVQGEGVHVGPESLETGPRYRHHLEDVFNIRMTFFLLNDFKEL